MGRTSPPKYSLKRHRNSQHRLPVPIYKCFIEGCHQRFNDRARLLNHQQCHVYSSAIFYTRAQAFNRTTLVLRQDLPDEGIGDFDFVTSTNSVSEETKIINSEIVNKGSIIFTIAITVNFVKVDMDGAISIKVSPCFSSKERYINNVSNYLV